MQEGKSEVKSCFPVSNTALVGRQPSVNIPSEHRECYLKEACYLPATPLLPAGVGARASWGENYTTGGKPKSRRKEKPINNQHGYSAMIRLSPDLLLYSGNCICLTGTVSGVQAWIHSPETWFERGRIYTLETKGEKTEWNSEAQTKRNENSGQHKLLTETHSAGVAPLSSWNSAVSQADAIFSHQKKSPKLHILHKQS